MRTNKTSKSATAFVKFIMERTAYAKQGIVPLSSLSFWMGAGFSKSWDPQYPIGDDLFTIKENEWQMWRNLSGFLATNNYHGLDELSPDRFREIVYQLGMFKKYPAIRGRFIDKSNIAMIENELRRVVMNKFYKTVQPYCFNEKTGRIEIGHRLNEAQNDIIKFFRLVMNQVDGSLDVAQGLRANFITTNYDNLIEAIIDASSSELVGASQLYLYRGITPVSINGEDNVKPIQDNWIVNSLFKINGGFEIYKRDRKYELDYRASAGTAKGGDAPQLMLPSKEQDYTQDYFKAIFPKAVRLLQESKALVIVGYSLPEDDSLLRFLMKQFAEDRADGIGRLVFYITKSNEREFKLKEKLESVWPNPDESPSFRLHIYLEGFDKWAAEVNTEARERMMWSPDNL